MRVCVRKGLPSGEICADLSPLVPFSFYFQMRACYRALVDPLVLTDLEKANGRGGRIEGGRRDLCLISHALASPPPLKKTHDTTQAQTQIQTKTPAHTRTHYCGEPLARTGRSIKTSLVVSTLRPCIFKQFGKFYANNISDQACQA